MNDLIDALIVELDKCGFNYIAYQNKKSNIGNIMAMLMHYPRFIWSDLDV